MSLFMWMDPFSFSLENWDRPFIVASFKSEFWVEPSFLFMRIGRKKDSCVLQKLNIISMYDTRFMSLKKLVMFLQVHGKYWNFQYLTYILNFRIYQTRILCLYRLREYCCCFRIWECVLLFKYLCYVCLFLFVNPLELLGDFIRYFWLLKLRTLTLESHEVIVKELFL